VLHINSLRCLTSSCPLWLHLHDICLYFFLFFFMYWLLSPWPSLTSITIRDLILLVAQVCSRCIPCVFSFAPRLYFLSLRVFLSLYPWLSQTGCGSGQPGLMVGDPAHSRGVETQWSLWSFSTQAILWYAGLWYDSVWYDILDEFPLEITFKKYEAHPISLSSHQLVTAVGLFPPRNCECSMQNAGRVLIQTCFSHNFRNSCVYVVRCVLIGYCLLADTQNNRMLQAGLPTTPSGSRFCETVFV